MAARIAVERRLLGGPSEIVVVDATTGSIERVARETPAARMSGPAWSPDGQTLLFAASQDGRPFEIHAMDVSSGKIRRLTNAGDSAQSPDISPDGKTLVFVGYTHAGYDLFSMALAEAVWEPVTDENRWTRRPRNRWSCGSPLHPPWSPATTTHCAHFCHGSGRRFSKWTMTQLWAGAATAGVDALGRHAYFGGATWSTRARPNWYAGYTYDRWRPIFFASAADDTDPWRRRWHAENKGGECWRVDPLPNDSKIAALIWIVPWCIGDDRLSVVHARGGVHDRASRDPCGVEHRYLPTIRLFHQRRVRIQFDCLD